MMNTRILPESRRNCGLNVYYSKSYLKLALSIERKICVGRFGWKNWTFVVRFQFPDCLAACP